MTNQTKMVCFFNKTINFYSNYELNKNNASTFTSIGTNRDYVPTRTRIHKRCRMYQSCLLS